MPNEQTCLNLFKEYNVIDNDVNSFQEIDLKDFRRRFRNQTKKFHPDKQPKSNKKKFTKEFQNMQNCKQKLEYQYKSFFSEFFELIGSNTNTDRFEKMKYNFDQYWVLEAKRKGKKDYFVKKMDTFRALVFLEYLTIAKTYLENGDEMLFAQESKRLSKLFFTGKITRMFLPESSAQTAGVVGLYSSLDLVKAYVYKQSMDFYIGDIIKTTQSIFGIAAGDFAAIPNIVSEMNNLFTRIQDINILNIKAFSLQTIVKTF